MRYNNGNGMNYDMLDNSSSSRGSNLPFNTWVKIIVYMDYDNRKIYSEIPLLNTFAVSDQFLVNSTSTDILEDFKLTTIYIQHAVNDYGRNIPLTNKCDNIKITALNAVPPHILSAESFLATKFNMYPNPATNLVTITNNEEAFINQIEIYDTAGKLLTTKNYNNKTEIQLNIAPLASGTYMLHLATDKGKAVKKLVKK